MGGGGGGVGMNVWYSGSKKKVYQGAMSDHVSNAIYRSNTMMTNNVL